jgi:hypothetical protein
MIFQAHHVIFSHPKKQSPYAFDLCSDITSCCAADLDGAMIHIFGIFHTTISFRFTIGFSCISSMGIGSGGNFVSSTDKIVTLYHTNVCTISSHDVYVSTGCIVTR